MQNHDHEAWLKIAKEDLLVAKHLARSEFHSSATFHCQQAAEKVLKGYLVFKGKPIVKTHDLVQLVELCMCIDQSFSKLFNAADFVNPLARKFRYPSEFESPDQAETDMAIAMARKIMTFVLKKISEPDSGQTNLFSDS